MSKAIKSTSKNHTLVSLVLLFCASSMFSTVSLAVEFGKLKFRLGLDSLVSVKYDEYSKLESTGAEKEISDIKLSGSQLKLDGTYNEYGMTIGYRSIKLGELEYFASRNETTVDVRYHHPVTPWLAPTFGYYHSAQTGDTAATDAPPAFVENNNALTFGLDMNVTAYTYQQIHSFVITSNVKYLTTLEKTRNFGNEYQFGMGYGYNNGNAQIGLIVNYLHQLYRAEKVEEDLPTYLIVRSLIEGITVGFYARN